MGLFKNVFFHCTYSIKTKIFNNYLFDDAKYRHFLRRADQLSVEVEGWGCQTSSCVIASLCIDNKLSPVGRYRAENGERNWGDTLINYVKPRKNPDCFAVYAQCCTKIETFVRVIVLLYRSPTFPTTFVWDCRLPSGKRIQEVQKGVAGTLASYINWEFYKNVTKFQRKMEWSRLPRPPPPLH